MFIGLSLKRFIVFKIYIFQWARRASSERGKKTPSLQEEEPQRSNTESAPVLRARFFFCLCSSNAHGLLQVRGCLSLTYLCTTNSEVASADLSSRTRLYSSPHCRGRASPSTLLPSTLFLTNTRYHAAQQAIQTVVRDSS